MRLGEGFRAPEPERAPEPDPVELLLRQLLAEMRQRPTEPLVVPAPEVRVEAPAPDLSELFAIVASQKPGATADEIAAAVARHLSPPEHGESPLFAELLTAIKALESRVHGVGMQAFGSSGPSNISSDATRRIGIVSGEGNMADLATQTTLAAVLAAVDTIETTQAAIETALEDRLPKNAKQFADGKYRTAGGKVSLSLATPNGSFHLSNPTGSGRSITITEFALGTTTAVDVAYWKDATSTGTTQSVFMPHRAYEGLATTVGVVKAGAGVLSGGTQLSPITRLPTQGERIPYTVVLMPGQSVAVQATATTTLDFYASVTWIEETL